MHTGGRLIKSMDAFALPDVEAAYSVLFSPRTAAADREAAEQWLVEWRKRPCSWEQALQLISCKDVDLAKFAAVTLHSKVHGQYNQLPAETIKLLLDKLLCHVIGAAHSPVAEDFSITSQVSAVVAALAVRSIESDVRWKDPVQELVSLTGLTSAPNNVHEGCFSLDHVTSLDRQGNPVHRCRVVLLILANIADEADDEYCTNIELVTASLGCIYHWLYLGVAVEDVVASNVLACLCHGITQPQVAAQCCSALSEFLSTGGVSRYPSTVDKITSYICSLMPNYESYARQTPAVAYAVSTVVTILLQEFTDAILKSHRLCVPFFRMALMCTWLCETTELSALLDGWFMFTLSLMETETQERDAAADLMEICAQLLMVIVRHVQCSEQDDVELAMEELSAVRFDVSFSIASIYDVLHQKAVELLWKELQSGTNSLHRNEAILFAFQSIGDRLVKQESIAIEPLIQRVLSFQEGAIIIATCAEVIVAFADRISSSNCLLSPCVEYLIQNLESGNARSVSACGRAFAALCEKRAAEITPHFDALYERLLPLLQGKRDHPARARLIEAFVHLVGSMETGKQQVTLIDLLRPIACNMRASMPPDSVQRQEEVMVELKLLEVLCKQARETPQQPHPLLEPMTEMFPILQILANRDPFVDVVLSILRWMVLACQHGCLPLLSPTLNLLVEQFKKHRFSTGLNLLHIITSIFRQTVEALPLLCQAYQTLLGIILPILESSPKLVSPSALKELYSLLQQLAKPELIDILTMSSLGRCITVTCSLLECKGFQEASYKQLLSFLRSLYKHYTESSTGVNVGAEIGHSVLVAVISAMIAFFSPSLISAGTDLLMEMQRSQPTRFPSWTGRFFVPSCPSVQRLSDSEREAFRQALQQPRTRNRQLLVMHSLIGKCRGEKVA